MSYQLVQLANGTQTLYSADYAEKMHPGLGPQAEADLLYVRQLNIPERMRDGAGEFVIWDVGLGAAANAIAVLRATREIPRPLRLVSFDNSAEPLEFALKNSAALGYLAGYEEQLAELLRAGRMEFANGKSRVNWEFHLGDFPALISRSSRGDEAQIKFRIQSEPPHVGSYKFPSPHAVLFDAFSPVKNPAMWTLPLFADLFRALGPARPCALTTYSRSTLLRVTLLLAGFFVGTGRATGLKEETTVAANSLDLIAQPLDARWLERARRSHSAEPLVDAVHRKTPLSAGSWEHLQNHPQFKLQP